MTEWLLLLLSLGLVAACGGFVAAEFALVTVDRASVQRAADAGDSRARGAAAALHTLSTQLSGAQLGITITNLAIGFLAEPAIAGLVDGPLEAAGVPERAVTPIAIGIGLGLATALTMVFGELVPKNLAIARPLATARATQAFQRGFTTAMGYPIRFLNGSANAILRWFGIEPQEELRSARSAEELASLVRRSASHGTLDAETARLMERTLAFGGRTAGDIMTPRPRMTSVQAADPVTAVVELARATGHSRFPVIDGDADHVLGAVHVKHAVSVPVESRSTTSVRQVLVPATVAPETLELDPLLTLLRTEGLQMAVVVDEYGGTAGVVTLEDVIEEIVGDIVDEHDQPGAHARRRRDGSWSLSGLLRPDEVTSLTGIALPEHEDYDTVAGLVLRLLGRLPEPGDTVSVPLPPAVPALDHRGDDEDAPAHLAELSVERMDSRRIDRVTLRRVPAPSGAAIAAEAGREVER